MLDRLLRVSLAVLLLPLAAAAEDYRYGKAELDQMLAPIALYPDSVLSHVLIAATYPDDVEEAARWTRKHPDLAGQDAVEAVDDRDWDASVKALVAFPEILARMDEDPDWTARLGEAFIGQQGDVMDRVQVLRERAYEEGRLDTEHTRIIRERETIYIEPAVTEVVFVPYYDPWYVYGSWWWADYPPYCWRTWYGRPVTYYHSGFWWGTGFRVAPTFYFAAPRWHEHTVVVVPRGPHDAWRPMYSGRDAAHVDNAREWRHEGSGVHMTERWRGRTERRSPDARSPGSPDTRQPHFPPRREWGEEHRELRHEAPAPRGGVRVEGYARPPREAPPARERGTTEGSERRQVRPAPAPRPMPREESRGNDRGGAPQNRGQEQQEQRQERRRGPHDR